MKRTPMPSLSSLPLVGLACFPPFTRLLLTSASSSPSPRMRSEGLAPAGGWGGRACQVRYSWPNAPAPTRLIRNEDRLRASAIERVYFHIHFIAGGEDGHVRVAEC